MILSGFTRAETVIYGVVSLFLIIGAVILIGGSAYHFLEAISRRGIEYSVLRALEDLLLVIMLAEILHTVGYTLKYHRLACEPFLVVGVIAAVRRMLIITAEMGKPTVENQEVFKLAMLEIGLLTGSIVALCIGIFLLQKLRFREGREEPDSPAPQ